MLQKIVNGIAITSGVVSIAVVGTVGYVYVRKDAIIESIKGKIMESVLPGGIGDALGGAGGGALGGAIQLPTSPTSPDAPTQSAPDAGLSLPSPF